MPSLAHAAAALRHAHYAHAGHARATARQAAIAAIASGRHRRAEYEQSPPLWRASKAGHTDNERAPKESSARQGHAMLFQREKEL